MIDISVIVVNYNTAELVKRCIESILAQRDVIFEIIVIDNASADNSVDVLREFDNEITLIANDNNLGFGKANNQGFRVSKGRHLFLLNPDAVLLTEHDLLNAVCYMDAHKEYGLVGTRIYDSSEQHVITLCDHYPRQKQSSVDFSKLPGKWATVLGASMLIPREVFEKVKGFDEDFFLYAEETDLCLRIRKVGFKIGYTEKVSVQHVGCASTRKTPAEKVMRLKKEAKYLFYKKHYTSTDVIKIAKNEMRKAKWQWLRLMFKKQILGLTSRDEEKLIRHQVTCDVASQVLQQR